MLRGLQKKMFGKKRFQVFFEKVYHFSKFGRNIGLPVDVQSSGEINFIQFIGSKLHRGDQFVFFDIGANHGVYTDHVMEIVPGKKCCYLFEPQPGLSAALKKKYAGNNDVMVIEKGCGSRQERVKLFSFEGTDTLASVYDTFKGTIQPTSFETVDIIKLDDFFVEQSIPFVDVAKIDVEGHELQVIKGMQQYMSQKKVSVIQFEFGSFNIASRTFFKDFWEILHPHYQLFRILKDGLVEIKNYSPDLELFDTTNYAAILRRK